MDQIKIGKFIASCRKDKKMTQVQLAEKLGVSDRSISKWENGKCMPDLSIFEGLCKELDINVNELLSGERIEEKDYSKKLEENIISTLDYTNSKITKEHQKISFVLIIIGIMIINAAFNIFSSESSWSSIYSILGIVVLLTGIYRELKFKKAFHKIMVIVALFISILGTFYTFDYIGVVSSSRPPIYRYKTTTTFTDTTITTYHNLFYNVYRIHPNTINEYYIVDTKKDDHNILISPFNRSVSGIDSIIKYQNPYVGNNSNDGNLIGHLPLSEYGFVFEIDSDEPDYGLIINYHTTDWYHKEDQYLEKSLVYNSISLFLLIDNLDYITYNFSGNSYHLTRNQLENAYINYDKLKSDNTINKDNFNKLVENKMNDNEFVEEMFTQLFKKANH